LEDAFGLPPLEAMACGLPVIVSIRAGVSEVVTDGVDGFLLKDPKDVACLSKLISALQNNPDLRQSLGDNAARTARKYTWERNAIQLSAIFEQAIKRLRYQNSSPIPDLQ
jgi:glycosyltransferase involved in cell wall biosynthesis